MESEQESEEESPSNEKENSGQLIRDATCTPADIQCPTDLWLDKGSSSEKSDMLALVARLSANSGGKVNIA